MFSIPRMLLFCYLTIKQVSVQVADQSSHGNEVWGLVRFWHSPEGTTPDDYSIFVTFQPASQWFDSRRSQQATLYLSVEELNPHNYDESRTAMKTVGRTKESNGLWISSLFLEACCCQSARLIIVVVGNYLRKHWCTSLVMMCPYQF